MKEEQPYYSYMLRLWQEDRENAIWRISLENAQTGKRRGFAKLDDMFIFLSQQIDGQSKSNPDQVSGEEVVPK